MHRLFSTVSVTTLSPDSPLIRLPSASPAVVFVVIGSAASATLAIAGPIGSPVREDIRSATTKEDVVVSTPATTRLSRVPRRSASAKSSPIRTNCSGAEGRRERTLDTTHGRGEGRHILIGRSSHLAERRAWNR